MYLNFSQYLEVKQRPVLFSTEKHKANDWVLISTAIKIQSEDFK